MKFENKFTVCDFGVLRQCFFSLFFRSRIDIYMYEEKKHQNDQTECSASYIAFHSVRPVKNILFFFLSGYDRVLFCFLLFFSCFILLPHILFVLHRLSSQTFSPFLSSCIHSILKKKAKLEPYLFWLKRCNTNWNWRRCTCCQNRLVVFFCFSFCVSFICVYFSLYYFLRTKRERILIWFWFWFGCAQRCYSFVCLLHSLYTEPKLSWDLYRMYRFFLFNFFIYFRFIQSFIFTFSMYVSLTGECSFDFIR